MHWWEVCNLRLKVVHAVDNDHWQQSINLGITGFARLTAGDTFQVSIRHDAQKWKTRGRTQSNKLQIWNESSSCTIVCKHQHIIHLKVMCVCWTCWNIVWHRRAKCGHLVSCDCWVSRHLRPFSWSARNHNSSRLISTQLELLNCNWSWLGCESDFNHIYRILTIVRPMTTLSNPHIIQRQSITDINRQSNNCTVRSSKSFMSCTSVYFVTLLWSFILSLVGKIKYL